MALIGAICLAQNKNDKIDSKDSKDNKDTKNEPNANLDLFAKIGGDCETSDDCEKEFKCAKLTWNLAKDTKES